MKTRIGLKGLLIITLRDRKGRIKKQIKKRNVITNVGKAQVAGLINGLVTSPFVYIAFGSGTTPASETDTALEAEIARKAGSVSRETTNVTNDTAVIETTFSSADGLTGTSDVSEAGLFDDPTAGNMLARQTFTAFTVNWDQGDTLTITWKITVS